jgi:hypothetical protein
VKVIINDLSLQIKKKTEKTYNHQFYKGHELLDAVKFASPRKITKSSSRNLFEMAYPTPTEQDQAKDADSVAHSPASNSKSKISRK